MMGGREGLNWNRPLRLEMRKSDSGFRSGLRLLWRIKS